ncbi:MAG: ABC transporter, partial [Novosphingobium sp.]
LPLAVLIQPRALGPEEFVALDKWVRGGGRLVLFADPMLHVHSSYPLGDKRRPQAIAMVDPLLAHWGLELHYDEDQPDEDRTVTVDGISVQVMLPGTLRSTGRKCRVTGGGIMALCRIGKGQAVIFADADMFDEPYDSAEGTRVSALNGILHLVDKRP